MTLPEWGRKILLLAIIPVPRVEWDDTVLQTQDSKFEPWRSEAEHATSRSQRLPTILTFTRGWEETFFVSFKPPRPGTEPRTLAWKAAVLTTTLGPTPLPRARYLYLLFSWQYAMPFTDMYIYSTERLKSANMLLTICHAVYRHVHLQHRKAKISEHVIDNMPCCVQTCTSTAPKG